MMIGSTKQEVDKFGARVIKLARINLGASRTIDGKKRVTNNTGALSKSLSYRIKQKRSNKGQFMSGFDVEFISPLPYAHFIEQGVKGSESTPKGTSKSPFKFKGRNIKEGVVESWMKSKPIRIRDLGSGKFSKNTATARKQVAFLIGRKIATHGITARNYMTDAVEKTIHTNGDNVGIAMAKDFIIKQFKLA